MKKCIWCNRTNVNVTFNKRAHTFPASLNGKNICDNVCDLCNHYFGSPTKNGPSVEIVLKEALNLSKFLLLHQTRQRSDNKLRLKSEFFKIDWETNQIKTKFKYNFRQSFQEKAGRQFRRGIFKVFLEERERQRKDALDIRFDFIREFARYDLSDLPVFYFKPKFKWLPFSLVDVNEPTIRFTEYSDEIDKEFRMYEYQIMGHYFAIPTGRLYHLTLDNYRKKLISEDNPFGTTIIRINRLEDLDFSFLFMNEKG